MTQRFIIKTLAFLAAALFVTSCASTDSDTVTEQAPSSVPGEKVSSDNQVMPNATSGVPSASIGW